jgi:hypothetical protein
MVAVPRTAQAYLGLMIVAGLLLGGLQAAMPDAAIWQLPPLLWLLGASLLFDVAVNQMAARGDAEPLALPWRVAGFLAAAALSILLPRLAGAS